MDWKSLLSSKRLNTTERPTDKGRSPFEKDYDRIVFCPAFRRLQRKTQVHPFPTNDHIHTRLTHSIEVSCVGRSLGNLVGRQLKRDGKLPDDIFPSDIGALVQVGCLAHDIGNPPFGHAGEYAVRDYFQRDEQKYLDDIPETQRNDFLLFEGNAQGFRFLTRLEYRPHNGGLRLTLASLGSFLKYPWTSNCTVAQKQGKFGSFFDDRETLAIAMNELKIPRHGKDYCWARHPLAYLVEAADDICYALLDLEDGREMGLLSYEEVAKVLESMGGKISKKDKLEYPGPRTRLALLRGGAFQQLISEVAEAFQKNERTISLGKFDDDLLQKTRSGKQVKSAKQLGREKVYSDRRKTQLEVGAYSTLDVLLTAFLEAAMELKRSGDFSKLSFKSQKLIELMDANTLAPDCSKYELMTRVLDFIVGMTDNYAAFIANQILGRAA